MPTPFLPGLVSVSFRKHPAPDVLSAAAHAGLRSIEWGGDVHCPHGDTAVAALLARLTRDAGLFVAAYGSYYRVGAPVDSSHWGRTNPDFRAVLDSALALGAPVIRVWAGVSGSAQTPQTAYSAVVDDLRRVCDLAASAGVRVGLEYHGGTLTDTLASTLRLSADCPDALLYWQPSQSESPEARLASLAAVAPKLAHLHVFHWRLDEAGNTQRRSLAEGVDVWATYLTAARAAPPLPSGTLLLPTGAPPIPSGAPAHASAAPPLPSGTLPRDSGASTPTATPTPTHSPTPPSIPRCAMLEFVPDDDIGVLPTEAAALRTALARSA